MPSIINLFPFFFPPPKLRVFFFLLSARQQSPSLFPSLPLQTRRRSHLWCVRVCVRAREGQRERETERGDNDDA